MVTTNSNIIEQLQAFAVPIDTVRLNPENAWEHPRRQINAMKPIALCEMAINNSSKVGDIVWDGFLGSGSTLIAAERLQRWCFGIELTPKYCDVIIKRWEDYTGKKAVKID